MHYRLWEMTVDEWKYKVMYVTKLHITRGGMNREIPLKRSSIATCEFAFMYVCVCMCVCVSVCVCVCVCIPHVSVCMFECMCVCIGVCALSCNT